MTISEPKKKCARLALLFGVAAVVAALLVPSAAFATIDGITDLSPNPSFSVTAKEGHISIPDGGSIYSWGYTTGAMMQLPGPTFIVTEGANVTVTLTNALPAAAGNVSIVFPGHVISSTTGGVPGSLTQEATPGGSVTYTFTASKPGTYQYHSGTRPDLQVEMGLYGALIVRPSAPAAGCTASAYAHPATCFEREYLFLLSEIDKDVHDAAFAQRAGSGPIDLSEVGPPFSYEYWLLNGRAAPDTMKEAGVDLLPNQPYNCMPMMHPGERLLMRVVGAGRQMHPYHHHGNHVQVLALDGNLILSETDPTRLAGPRLFTIPSMPGGTIDAIFEWTGKDLGWDIYGTPDFVTPTHNCIDNVNNKTGVAPPDGYADASSDYPWEWCPDHNKPIPVELPNISDLTFGGFWSGSPWLGALGSLPPGEGGLNPNAGFTFMWHSHNEREMVNNDVFPGGMMTMLTVEAPWVTIP